MNEAQQSLKQSGLLLALREVIQQAFEAEDVEGLAEKLCKVAKINEAGEVAGRVLEMCRKRNYSMHWSARIAYLMLEAAELGEALRGKGSSSPKAEAVDVLMVLMSITEELGIDFNEIVLGAHVKTQEMLTKPIYEGEAISPWVVTTVHEEVRTGELEERVRVTNDAQGLSFDAENEAAARWLKSVLESRPCPSIAS